MGKMKILKILREENKITWARSEIRFALKWSTTKSEARDSREIPLQLLGKMILLDCDT